MTSEMVSTLKLLYGIENTQLCFVDENNHPSYTSPDRTDLLNLKRLKEDVRSLDIFMSKYETPGVYYNILSMWDEGRTEPVIRLLDKKLNRTYARIVGVNEPEPDTAPGRSTLRVYFEFDRKLFPQE